jgi:TRAP-type mannitol/chloroaromatic compound transport system permease large subunit
MIIYGLSAQVAIGDLFIAGAIPGVMLALFYIIYVLVRCKLDPSLAPTAAESAARSGQTITLSPNRKMAVALSIALVFFVMGSIYAGIASVTEAAGVGVLGAVIVAVVRGRFNWDMLQVAVTQTMSTVGTIITVPIFAPVVQDLAPALGMDPAWAAVWFGVLFVMNIQIYFLSPPFGPACFWLKSVAPPEITLQEIFRAVIPFIGLQIIGMLLVMFIPEIALWLPQLLTDN